MSGSSASSAMKNVTINESHFQGHFPGKPIMPGVLIIEAMAQTGGLLLLMEVPDRENKLLFFVAVDGARFRRPVVPGDQLRLEMSVLAWRGDFCKLEGKAPVDGEFVAEATLMCKMVDREPRRKSLEGIERAAGIEKGTREEMPLPQSMPARPFLLPPSSPPALPSVPSRWLVTVSNWGRIASCIRTRSFTAPRNLACQYFSSVLCRRRRPAGLHILRRTHGTDRG